jgi:hypothetical protein
MKFKALLVAILLISVFCVSGTALALTEQETQTIIAQLQAQIDSLLQQINQLIAQQQSTTSQQTTTPQNWCYTFNTNLGFVNSGTSDVGQLHTALTKQGISFSPDTGNTYSNGTATAVSVFQERYAFEILSPNGLNKGTGFFGDSTRVKLNQLYGCEAKTYDTVDTDNQAIVCAQDARQCADGSWVSRVPPSCNFAPCPTTQTCTANNWIFNLSPETCPSSGQQTKIWTKIGTCTGGISKPAYEVVSCSYQSNACTSFNYSNWSACSSSGIQTRTVTSSYPSGCTGGNPVTSQACTYTETEANQTNTSKISTLCIPNWECTAWTDCHDGKQYRSCWDKNVCRTTNNLPTERECTTKACVPMWSCDSWGACSNGSQQRNCTDTNYCDVGNFEKRETQSCDSGNSTDPDDPFELPIITPRPSCITYWKCTDWTPCSSAGTQTRSCYDLNECPTPSSDKPQLTRTGCTPPRGGDTPECCGAGCQNCSNYCNGFKYMETTLIKCVNAYPDNIGYAKYQCVCLGKMIEQIPCPIGYYPRLLIEPDDCAFGAINIMVDGRVCSKCR